MVYNIYTMNAAKTNWQVDVISVRPDDPTKKKLRRRFRSATNLAKRTLFYRRAFALGVAAIEKEEERAKCQSQN